ncbi:MAG: hypothetical protein IJ447_02055 [Clostridia bacterium]|nr:hypothetical protein [Clostridia bacterium]
MQNKYKMPSDVRKTVIGIVQGYERRKIELKRDEEDILSLGSGKFETVTDDKGKETERAFMPSGKGGKSSAVENQALRLMNLHNSFDYKCNEAIDQSLAALPLNGYDPKLAEKVKEKIMLSCVLGKRFIFRYEGLEGVSERTFYRFRSRFLYFVAKKLDFL